MANHKRAEVVLVADPPTDELGPAMLALTPHQRRFVIAWIASGGKNAAQAARAAGYSQTEASERVQAHYLSRNPKVLRALQEEAGRTLNGMAAFAVAKLQMQLNSSKPKVVQGAIDSILDRTGFPRRTERSLDVTDVRQQHNHEQLLTMVSERLRVLVSQEPKLIESAQYTEMEDVAHADAVVPAKDERSGDNASLDASSTAATSKSSSGARKARKG